jgi:predicted SAM-dependent methyltransferase
MSIKNRWLEFLIPSFRQKVKELEHLREENKKSMVLVSTLERAKEDLQQQLKKQQDIVAKLKTKLEVIELERQEVYRQYNRLLEQVSPSAEEAGGVIVARRMRGPVGNDPKSANESEGWRLNVGCGSVKKEGYLNVDVDPSVKPDLILSLDETLPFLSGVFERVEAYHVVEHVYPWMALDVLKDFLRILKPGGKLAIECPNIESACSWLSGNPHYDWDSQMGMWAIYGDPNSRNPFYMHKWGYTPVTLSQILREAGFIGVQREPPETHVPSRDFRIVATKPTDNLS